MRCPKCGFEQPQDVYCANCGVDMAVFAAAGRVRTRVGLIAGLFLVTIIVAALFILRRPAPEKQEPPVSGDTLQTEVEPELPKEPPPQKEILPEPKPVNKEAEFPVEVPPTEETLPEDEKPLNIPGQPVEISGSALSALEYTRLSGLKLYSMKGKYLVEAKYILIDGPAQSPDAHLGPDDILIVDGSDLGPKAPREEWPNGFDRCLEIEVRGDDSNEVGRIYLFYFEYPPSTIMASNVEASDRNTTFSTSKFTIQMDLASAMDISLFSVANYETLISSGLKIFIAGSSYGPDKLSQSTQTVFAGTLGVATKTTFDLVGLDETKLSIEDLVFTDRVRRTYRIFGSENHPLQEGNLELVYGPGPAYLESGKLVWNGSPSENGFLISELESFEQMPAGRWFAVCDTTDVSGVVVKAENSQLSPVEEEGEQVQDYPFSVNINPGDQSASLTVWMYALLGPCNIDAIKPLIVKPNFSSISAKEFH